MNSSNASTSSSSSRRRRMATPSPSSSMGNRSSAAAATTSATQINHNNDNHNINDKDNKALQQFHDAMAAVPLETKRDYWTAVQQVPDVVDRESNPLRFIRYARDNFWAAAERMCAYWQLRVQLWGRHRAWRPLTMDGTGALNEQDILVLQAGFPAVLPPSADGKQVIFFDRSKWLPSVTDRDNRLRATFYLLNLLSQDPQAQVPGGTIAIINLIQPRMLGVDHQYVETTIRMLTQAIPFHAAVHYTCQLPRTMSRSVAMKQSVADCISFYTKPRSCEYTPNLHFDVNPGDMLRALMNQGLRKEGIPSCAGGSWTFDGVAKWCKAQALKELGSSHGSSSNGNGGSATIPLSLHSPKAAAAAVPKNPNQRKIMNAIFSRQKRERRKQELENLKREHVKLQESNASLQAEQARLQRLLCAAQTLVRGDGSSSSVVATRPEDAFANPFAHSSSSSSSSLLDPSLLSGYNSNEVAQHAPKKRRQENPALATASSTNHHPNHAAQQLSLEPHQWSSSFSGPNEEVNQHHPWSRPRKRRNSALWSLQDDATAEPLLDPTLFPDEGDTTTTHSLSADAEAPMDASSLAAAAAFASQQQERHSQPTTTLHSALWNHNNNGSDANRQLHQLTANATASAPPALTCLPNELATTVTQSSRSEQGFLLMLLQQSNTNWVDMSKAVLTQATPWQRQQIQSWLLQQQQQQQQQQQNAPFPRHNTSS